MKATGERWERCQWQMKRPERVAAVDRCQGARRRRQMSGTATGIVRRVDDLGRIVIPKEIRRTLKIREGDPLHTTLTPFDRFCCAIHSVIKRYKETAE